MLKVASFFQERQRQLKYASALYVALLILSHAAFPPVHVWIVAAVFSVLMNGIYIIEAYALRTFFRTEFFVAVTLVLASVLGVLVAPIFVILAILGHGLWDVAKHFGAGVPFFSWYTWGCFVADVTYSTLLLIYWLTT